MPICKHLKPVGDCLECRPKTERVGYFMTAKGAVPMSKENVKTFDDELAKLKKENPPKPKFGLVRDVVQKINGKAKPKGRRVK